MTLNDAQARAEAIKPAQSYIIQAPAGSGKTGLLVRRVLMLLCVVERPEEILAITFTRKATAEMRERVLEALNRADQQLGFKTHEADLQPIALAALARDRDKNWQLLRQPQRLKIQTIDALCTDLVRKMPWSSRFGGVPKLETDLDSLYAETAQNLIRRIDEAPFENALGHLLINVNGNLDGLKRQFMQMLTERESWLRLIFQGVLDNRETLCKHWKSLQDSAEQTLAAHLGDTLSLELLDLARHAEEHRPAGSSLLDEDARAELPGDSPSAHRAITTGQWQIIAGLICKADGFYKTLNVNHGFAAKSAAKLRISEILKELADDPLAYSRVNQFRQCPDPDISDAEWQQLQALKLCLTALAQELYVLMAERNVTDYDELTQRAIYALGEPGKPTDLALVQDYQLKHILMDEFQDTSPTQLQLLERLTEGWEPNTDRSLFFVGDPMQSIYAFRKADVRVFLQVRDGGLNDMPLKALSLSTNFRSAPELIDWVNHSLRDVFPDRDQPELAKVKFSPSKTAHDFAGEVHYHACISRDAQCETNAIIELIQQYYQNDPQQEIAVLARKRAPLAAIAEGLRAAQVPFESVELESLADQTIVQDLISLSSLFMQAAQALPWLAALRAPWCGLSLADLTTLSAHPSPFASRIENAQLIQQLSPDGQIRIARFAASITPVLAIGKRLSLQERVHRAWLGLRGPACYPDHALKQADIFFELLDTLEKRSAPLNRGQLLKSCVQLKTSSPISLIKLMTIHRAKGLEFERLILVGMHARSGGDNRKQSMLIHTQIDDKTFIATPSRATEPSPTKAEYIKQYNSSIESEEAARLLYVAVTRAKRTLHLFATLKKSTKGDILAPQKGSLLNLLWPTLQEDFETSDHLIDASNIVELGASQANVTATPPQRPEIPLLSLPEKQDKVNTPPSFHFAPKELLQSEQIEFSWAKEDTRLIGLAAHKILQFADLERVKSWQDTIEVKALRASLIRTGLIENRLSDATERLSKMLENMSTDPRAQWLFDPEHQDVHSEWALSGRQEDRVAKFIIDRSFIDKEGVRWIVDFKTGVHEGSDASAFLDEEEKRYTAQLNQYANLVQALEPDREIRLGLYFPALKAWRERSFRS